ncbi:hypothetical protein [Rhizobium halophytocola]|uniref:KTSC domain-containing protein n=1 Tax=Rhizobium halophytocola TaxID=735519 RepID=A0ABS4DVJ0_9HYPH|nr:hypothetical protein [Rhizobium halophytocola]MBP1849708.1 hypothetical protein [Rhizobium halophytocola]
MSTFDITNQRLSAYGETLWASEYLAADLDLFDEDDSDLSDFEAMEKLSSHTNLQKRAVRAHRAYGNVVYLNQAYVDHGTAAVPQIKRSSASAAARNRVDDATVHPPMAQNLTKELARLQVGWAGPDTVPPPDAVIQDILHVASCLPSNVSQPEAEVDPDDGSVVLRWLDKAGTGSFTLTFLGKGYVTGFASTSALSAWKMAVSEYGRLNNKFAEISVARLIQS